MTDIAIDFQVAVEERNYSRSSQLIETASRTNTISDLLLGLEEIESKEQHVTLERRDHIFHYLGMWDIYYAVQIPSIYVLDILQENNVQENPQEFMVDFIRTLLDTKDGRFDQFCINIQTISKGHYAILVPSILEQRTEELSNCKIQYKDSTPKLYCIADLLDTYYGSKIVTATQGHRFFDIVTMEEEYLTIKKSLAATGFDTDSMLVKIDSNEWDDYVKNRRRPRRVGSQKDSAEDRYEGSRELEMLHRVKSARSSIYSSDFNQQHKAMLAIIDAKSQLCNDILSDIATDSSHSLRNRALKQLGEFGDHETLDLLDDIMKNDRSTSVRKEAARAYSALTSRLAGMKLIVPSVKSKPPIVDIARTNSILNNLLAKGMPSTMIDETLDSVALQGGSNSVEILLRLLHSRHELIRKAIVRATRLLDKSDAALIIRKALEDESPEVIRLAENQIDTRWSDEVWQ
ncbi:MAG: HEAT repeat domain-containing protein [Candidatus Thorarchaeota archaeon]